MKILLATTNTHKLNEIIAVMNAPAIVWVSLSDLDMHVPEPVEDQDSFAGNAALKARYYAKAAGMLCLADDSGLEVDALNGQPGVHSARYAGVDGPRSMVDRANNKKLLQQLAGVETQKRTARFVCAMALCQPDMDQPVLVARGIIAGRILCPDQADDDSSPHRGRGTNGFGYDPLFFVPHLNKTTAELSPQEKNHISHRGKATRAMWKQLKNF